MPDIEISEDQRAYLEDLRAELADEHVGEYGAVRPRDALQFLIDHREGGVEAGGDDTERADGEDPDENANDPDEDASDPDEETGDADGPGRLQAMMRLLDDHDDKWDEADSEQGKYVVTLPDGGTEHVRTKDDVRGLLFKHYS